MDPFAEYWGAQQPQTAGGPLTQTLALIKQFEGYTPKPKWDYKQHSVGYGTRWEPGTPYGSKADHEAALAREAGQVDSWIGKNVRVPLDANKRAALTSFGFNLGTDDLQRLLPDINAGNWDSVARRMPTFNKAGGEVNEGLVNRRNAEVRLMIGGQVPAPQRGQAMNNIFPMRPPTGSGTETPMIPQGGMGNLTGEGGYFGRLFADPTFLTGASVLSAGLQGRDFGSALASGAHGASAIAEQAEKRRKAAAWSKMFGPNGPNMESPLLKNLPPDVLPIIQQMGPEEGLNALAKLAFKRMEPADLMKVGPGDTVIDQRTRQPVYTHPMAQDPTKAPSGYRFTPDGGSLEAIPGGPATALPGEQAGRIALMRTARDQLGQAKSFFSDMGISGRVGKVFNAGEAGEAERTVSSAIEATLRALTGAAATRDEVARYERLFAPTIWDAPKTRADKLKRLEDFITEAETTLMQGRGGVPQRAAPQTNDDPLGILD